MSTATSSQCCPKFDPQPWDGTTHTWKNKRFIKETLPQIFHMPLPGTIGRMMKRQWQKIEAAQATPPLKDFLWLSFDPSPWQAEHYLHVTKKVPQAENVTISGTFMTKVFDGPYNAAPKWLQEMEQYLKVKKKTALKYYFYYTTCPKCIKKYGHNYVVVFAQIK